MENSVNAIHHVNFVVSNAMQVSFFEIFVAFLLFVGDFERLSVIKHVCT